jgi:hypothetical protein
VTGCAHAQATSSEKKKKSETKLTAFEIVRRKNCPQGHFSVRLHSTREVGREYMIPLAAPNISKNHFERSKR